MRTRTLTATFLSCLLIGLAAGPAAASTTTGGNATDALRPLCGAVPAGHARCLTWYHPRATRATAAATASWGAKDLRAAYRVPAARKTDALVAVSIAYDAPDLESDLNAYRKRYGLGACTVAGGCLTKVNQRGNPSPLPSTDAGWAVEETLDVSMISAACPQCRILVVEGDSNSTADLAATEDTAVAAGAQVVSNSYGADENEAHVLASHYNHPGHVVVASSGDYGFGPTSFPASLRSVTAVGGTVLAKAANARGWKESAWPHGGSGCSAWEPKPSWQHDSHCAMRTTADVSAAAEGIALYVAGEGGWGTVGGTSASAPFIAGLYGLAGNAATVKPGDEYRHTGALFDVKAGTNDPSNEQGGACGHDYLCQAKTGYDAPTGLGSPDGIGAF